MRGVMRGDGVQYNRAAADTSMVSFFVWRVTARESF